jgi:nicotinamidase-related amidase
MTNTILQEYLQRLQISSLVICGAMSHMCIDSTTRAAADSGYLCTFISDACATRDLIFRAHKVKAADVQIAYLAAINGTFAEVISTEKFLNSWH